jgi:hypothetical protein
MFKSHHEYIHSHTLDIQLTVLKVQYACANYVKVKGILSNRHDGVYYEMGTYKIYKKDFKHWIDKRVY